MAVVFDKDLTFRQRIAEQHFWYHYYPIAWLSGFLHIALCYILITDRESLYILYRVLSWNSKRQRIMPVYLHPPLRF